MGRAGLHEVACLCHFSFTGCSWVSECPVKPGGCSELFSHVVRWEDVCTGEQHSL